MCDNIYVDMTMWFYAGLILFLFCSNCSDKHIDNMFKRTTQILAR